MKKLTGKARFSAMNIACYKGLGNVSAVSKLKASARRGERHQLKNELKAITQHDNVAPGAIVEREQLPSFERAFHSDRDLRKIA